ncbi:FAD-binding monooxygenase [Sphingomonas gilva]|uniref:FAD-binding monooxygenase n=1 Tax=Sphingomonas gilva TaxID=2305907 RepID=A0A396RVE5_9SPHN|nr:FAD-dependent monooxygenase [Sphingomonas gilva]RHW17641.1 FAD-binding monooxygenase [Sphingomonas gilva]
MGPLIVGGGPAGSAAAIRLARWGIRPLLIERTREPGDALCGGFLSWRTLDGLARLGIGELDGAPVRRLRLFAGETVAERPLPAPAMGISRLRLDRLMIEAAARAGARVERGAAARGWAEGFIRVDADEWAPDGLFLATGKHELRGLARPREAAGSDPAIGLRVRLGPHPTLDRLIGDAIELHLFDRGYAGLVRHEDGSANLCMAVRKSRLDEAGGPEALLGALARLPHLGERMACRRRGTPDAVAHVPYGWRARAAMPGIFRLGDQAGVIPSLAGEGMGIAIASGVRAADLWLGHGVHGATHYQAAMGRALGRPIGVASLIGSAAQMPLLAPWLVRLAGIPGAADLIARATRVRHD